MNKKNKTIIILMGILILILAGATAYLLISRDSSTPSQEDDTNSQQTQDTTDKLTKEEDRLEMVKKRDETIKAVMATMNTQPLIDHMAESVEVILAASEGLPNQTPEQAVAALNYFKDSKDWDFNLDQSVTGTYKKSVYYGAYFDGDTLVGRASNSEVIVFQFDGEGKISRIFMATSDSLF